MSAMPSEEEKASACRELRNRIGAAKVRDDEITLVTYGRIRHGFDAMWPFRKPCFVVFPETREDVVATVKIANEFRIPISSVGTAPIMLGTTEGGIIIDQRRRDRILEINTDSGYAVIEPGVSFDRLTAALDGTDFKCSVGTMPGPGTVLGQALGRGSQSFTTRYLSVLLDLEVVLPSGLVFSTGSSHFEGVGSHLRYGPYPDLAGLYTCAYGAMGVITKAAVRIHPRNEVSKVNLAGFGTYADALDYVKDLINNNVPEHTFIWNWHMYTTWPLGPEDMQKVMPGILDSEVTRPPDGTPYTLVSTLLSGYKELVDVYEQVCAKVAEKYRGRVLPEAEVKERFPATLAGFDQQYGDFHYRESVHWNKGRFMGWYVFAEPADMKEIEQYAINEFAEFGKAINPINYYSHPFDYGRSVLMRMSGFPNPDDIELRKKMAAKFEEMYDVALKKYRAVPIRPIGSKRAGTYMEVLRTIKKALDPNNIMGRNSGLFEEGEI